MDKFTFRFKGESSDKYGIYASSVSPANTPKRQAHKKIDFRHGEFDFENDMFSPQYLDMQCFWTRPITRHEMREITLWLTGKAQLFLDFEPDKHYNSTIYDRSELEVFFNRWSKNPENTMQGTFRLVWYCSDPFAYSALTTLPVRTGYTNIDYKGTASTPTMIRLVNNSNVPVSQITVTALSLF